jgi:hypothetical protein
VKRNSKKSRRTPETMRVWTLDQARAASPYIASVVRSLREYVLAGLAARRELNALDAKPGRPNRDDLIARQEAERSLGEAEKDYTGAAEELADLDVYSLDPLKGQALVPFVHDDQLAWYVFDLFDTEPIRAWRYQTDPEHTRRKLTAVQRS